MSPSRYLLVSQAGLLALVLATTGCPAPPPLSPPPPRAAFSVDRPAPSAEPAPVASAPEAGSVKLGAVMMTGGLGMSDGARAQAKNSFIAAFEAGKASFLRCYAAAVGRSPGLTGRMDVEVVLARDGSVYELKPGSAKLDDPQMERCVLQALRELGYEPLADGEYFSITPVLTFAPE